MSGRVKFLLSLIETWKAEGCAAGECLKSNMNEFSILIIVMNPWAQILQVYLLFHMMRCLQDCCLCALTLKSEFFFNLPYKDWIVRIDVFQVNAQIVPEIV